VQRAVTTARGASSIPSKRGCQHRRQACQRLSMRPYWSAGLGSSRAMQSLVLRPELHRRTCLSHPAKSQAICQNARLD
jgi:hypothetical protein